ncbi:MAG: hypothetical protein JNL38_17165 [Myxococcales bacterium]|nr:hypothetical protein [Myxococcales bacterium]
MAPHLRLAAALRLALRLALLFGLVVGALGCQDDVIPELVKVTDIVPREAEVGDRLEIAGVGFPQGRTAKITFRGELRRPGERPRSAKITTEGLVTSQSRIELVMNDALEAAFCDRGDQATHTTFVGSIEVAFSGAVRGGPPIAGVLDDASLDLRPVSVRAHKAQELTREGRAVAAHLGLDLEPAVGRLAVRAVAARSHGERAGIRPGDAILALDGVRTRELADLATAQEHAAEVRILRGDPPKEHVREVPLEGLHLTIPREMATALGLVAAAVVLALLLFAPLPGSGDLDDRVGEHLRAPLGDHDATLRWALARLRAPGVLARLVVVVVVSAALAVAAATRVVVQGDVLGLAALSAGALTAALVLGGRSLPRAAIALRELVKLASLVVAAHAAGSLSLHEIVRGQGAAPWEWGAFASPGLFGLAAIVCVHHAKTRAAWSRVEGGVAAAFAGAHDALTAIAITTMLGGGWPAGANPIAQALVLVAKALVLLGVFAVVAKPLEADAALPSGGALLRRVGRALSTLALPVVVLTAVHAAWLVLPLGGSVRLWVARGLVGLVVALALRFVVRVAHAAERRPARVDPYA